MRDFRKIKAWQLADELTVQLYTITKGFPKDELYRLKVLSRRGAGHAETKHNRNSNSNMTENEIGSCVVKACIKVHQALGPGLLESVYQKVLAHELEQQGLSVRCEVPILIRYDNIEFEEGFRADIIVENKVILELKSVEKIAPIHMKQLHFQHYRKYRG